MKILVYGAGVLGSIFAARLHKGGHNVSLLARGQRLSDLREHGLVLVDDLKGECQVYHVKLVEGLATDDAYDLVLVIMRKNQVATVLPILAANQHTPTVAFLGNNTAGADAYVAALGRERVLMGFAGAAGARDGHIIRHVRGTDDRPASLCIGELDSQMTPRLRAIVAAFERAGFRVQVSSNIDAWLKSHVAFVSPIADALLLAGGDNYRLAHTRDGLVLMIRAIRESFAALSALGLPVLRRMLAGLALLPEPILVPLSARLLNTRAAELALTRHARAAGDEMRTLAAELRSLVTQSGVATPNLDRLESFLNPTTPSLLEGSQALSLNWTSTLCGLLMTVVCALYVLRRLNRKKSLTRRWGFG
jgi:2-dehydropantoate 2-reductase